MPIEHSMRTARGMALSRTAAAAGMGAAALLGAAWWNRVRRTRTLRNRVALITGGSRGLGLLLARELLDEGAHVAICARDADELGRAVAQLGGRAGDLIAIPADLRELEGVYGLAREVERRLGPVDVLVNNAGVMQVAPLDDMDLDDFHEAMDVHFEAPLRLIEAVLPHMRRQGWGRIVNVSSIGGRVAMPHMLPYSASKFALAGLSEGLRAELHGTGVCVTTVIPGLMRTGSTRHATFKGHAREEHRWFALSAALPLLSSSAEHAARRIARAIRRGKAEVVITAPAKLAILLHAAAPGVTSDLLGLAERYLLPEPGGAASRSGAQSGSRLAPSALTTLNDRAAARLNE